MSRITTKARFLGCVLLTPSPDADAWRAALISAAGQAGLEVIEAIPGQPAVEPKGDAIVIAAEVEDARPHAPTAWAALVSRPQAAVESASADGIRDVSRRLSHALAVAGTTFGDTGSGLVTLFGRLDVTPPEPSSAGTPGELAGDALAMFADGLPGPGASCRWGYELFVFDDRYPPVALGPLELEIMGRARYMVGGPYIVLPPGEWRVRARFALDQDAARRRFRFEWGEPRVDGYVEQVLVGGAAGRYELEMSHRLTEPAPCELRVVLAEAALAGRFILEEVTVDRVA